MSEPVKVAIIGSGPAGLSAASRAGQLGLSHILLEKTDHLSDTIFKYQKGKRVLATPERLDLRSDCRFAEGAREYILGNWDEDAVNYKVKFEGPVDLLFDLREMIDFTLDVAWEDIVFSRAHADDFTRVAVLTDSQWVAWSTWLSKFVISAELRVFGEEDEARAWLDEGLGLEGTA